MKGGAPPDVRATSNQISRILLVVLDGLGVGSLLDAPPRLKTAHSLGNAISGGYSPRIPFLSSFGLLACAGLSATLPTLAWGWGRTRQASRFNESYTAHWEMAGYVATRGHGHPDGLSEAILAVVDEALGQATIGNLGCYPRLSGIPFDLLDAHRVTRRPILLTQVEEEPVSVIAVYACADVVPPHKLFAMVSAAAPRLAELPLPGRICARVFDVLDGRISVRSERLDIPYFKPPSTSLLDAIMATGRSVRATGKVGGLFANRGFTAIYDHWGDAQIIADTIRAWTETTSGLVWANFNTLSRPAGANRDCFAWLRALELYDKYLERLYSQLGPRDVMILTGDHGVDPSLTGEHTVEWTPLLVGGRSRTGIRLGGRRHSDIAATIVEWWSLEASTPGRSFASALVAEQKPDCHDL